MHAKVGAVSAAYALAVIAFLGACPALAANYSYTQLDVPGASYTIAQAVSASGQVAGVYGAGGRNHGFVWSAGTFTELNIDFKSHKAAQTRAIVGINDSGILTGYGTVSPNISNPIAFTYKVATGATKLINISGSLYSQPFGLNSKNALVGTVVMQDGDTPEGFLIKGRTTTLLTIDGARSTNAVAINDSGVIAGNYNLVGDSAALNFTFHNGNYTTWQPPGASSSLVTGIDSAGDVSGNILASDSGISRGFVKIKKKFTILRYPGAKVTEAVAPVPGGQVIGNYGTEPNKLFTNAFNYVGGVFYNILPPGAGHALAQGSNGSGTIVGQFDNGIGGSSEHGFIATCAGGAGACTN